MKQVFYTVRSNDCIARDIWRCTLEGDTSAFTRPGQFLNLKLDGQYLRRPISVCDLTENLVTIIYKVVGAGTAKMAAMPAGTVLDALTGLGNGFEPDKSGSSPLLIGGGVGVPPLYLLARQLRAQNKSVTVVTGFNTDADVFYTDEFEALGCTLYLTTADGSAGKKGFVTDILPQLTYTAFYACGPEPMLKAVCGAAATTGYLSFEERMGCGFGACMGCSCQTIAGAKRICRDGPVMQKEEIVW